MTKQSTDFLPSKKFLKTIAHKTPAQQDRTIKKWQSMRLEQYRVDIDKGLVNDGIDTGSFYAHLKFRT